MDIQINIFIICSRLWWNSIYVEYWNHSCYYNMLGFQAEEYTPELMLHSLLYYYWNNEKNILQASASAHDIIDLGLYVFSGVRKASSWPGTIILNYSFILPVPSQAMGSSCLNWMRKTVFKCLYYRIVMISVAWWALRKIVKLVRILVLRLLLRRTNLDVAMDTGNYNINME